MGTGTDDLQFSVITIHTTTITESTTGFCDIIDITAKVKEISRARERS